MKHQDLIPPKNWALQNSVENFLDLAQLTFTCSKSIIETLKKGVK